MVAFTHNAPLDLDVLTDLFSRSGWSVDEPERAVEWAVAASDSWIACVVDEELVAFGRTCRLDELRSLACDVVVDERYRGLGLEEEIIRRLAGETEGDVLVLFPGLLPERGRRSFSSYQLPEAPPGTYVG